MVQNGLQRILVEDITAPSTSAAPQAPTFRGMHYSGEILRVTCEDAGSRKWLEQAVSRLGNLWDNCSLKVVRADQLPRLARVTIWVRGPPEEQAVALALLAAQNPWAEVGKWLSFFEMTQEQPPGRLLVKGVPEETAKEINSRGGRLSYKFSSLRVKVRFNKPPNEGPASPEHSKEARDSQDREADIAAELSELLALNLGSEPAPADPEPRESPQGPVLPS